VLRRAAPALVFAVALATGCRGCSDTTRGAAPERFLPASVQAAVVARELARAARDLSALHATLAVIPGAAGIAGARAGLASQLGFDPLDPEALRGAGLDARRGGALALVAPPVGPGAAGASPTSLLVLPVSDTSRLEALLVRLARERLGAGVRTDARHGGATVAVLRRGPGDPAALSFAIVQRTALVAPGAAGPEVVGEAARLSPEAALGESEAFRAAREAAGEGAAALVFVPTASPLVAAFPHARGGVGIGLSADRARAHARAALLAGGRETALRALEASGAAAAAAARLRGDAGVVLRWDGDPAALGERIVPLVPAADRARFAAHGVDLRRDLFGVLAPGAAVALSLSPRAAVSALSPDVLRADPLRLIELEAILPVKGEAEAALARVAAALAETVPAAPALAGAAGGTAHDAPPGARRSARAGGARPADNGESATREHAIVRIPTASGEIAWRLEPRSHRLVLAAGAPGRLDALLARLEAGGEGFRAPTAAADAALSGGLGGAVIDVQRVVADVRALPVAAFGTGPTGFVMRSLAQRFLDPAARLAAISLEARVARDALVLDVTVEAGDVGGAAR
jgi:hypothetical protein